MGVTVVVCCVCVCTRWGELWIRWRFQYRDWNRTLGEGSWESFYLARGLVGVVGQLEEEVRGGVKNRDVEGAVVGFHGE